LGSILAYCRAVASLVPIDLFRMATIQSAQFVS